MIGKQPLVTISPSSMQDYLPDLDYAVYTMVCLTAANFRRGSFTVTASRLSLFNLTYRLIYRHIEFRSDGNEKFLSFFLSIIHSRGVRGTSSPLFFVRNLPRYFSSLFRMGGHKHRKGRAGQKGKRDYGWLPLGPGRGNGSWKIRNGVNNYATTIIGERNYDYAPLPRRCRKFPPGESAPPPESLPAPRSRGIRARGWAEGGRRSAGRGEGKSGGQQARKVERRQWWVAARRTVERRGSRAAARVSSRGTRDQAPPSRTGASSPRARAGGGERRGAAARVSRR